MITDDVVHPVAATASVCGFYCVPSKQSSHANDKVILTACSSCSGLHRSEAVSEHKGEVTIAVDIITAAVWSDSSAAMGSIYQKKASP